jgi:type I restriction enzyme S subunit
MWTQYKLGDVCQLKYGKNLPAESRIEGIYPVYGSSSIVSYHKDFLVNKPGIIIGRKGTVGKVQWSKMPFFPIDTTFYVEEDENLVDIKFLYYLLPLCNLESMNSDAAVPGLNRNAALAIKFKLPPLPTQKRIASILSAYDDLIENNLKRIKLLEEIAQRTYEEWFVKFRVNGVQLAIDEATGLPDGWMNIELGSFLIKLESGGRPKGGIDKDLKNGIPSIGAENVLGLGQYKYGNEKIVPKSFFEKMRKGIVEDKDILVYKDGAYIGKTSMFQDGFPHEVCAVNEHVFLINTGKSELQNYLFFTLNRREYFMKMQSLNSNAAQPGINQEKLKSLEITIPILNIINDYHIVAEPLTKQIFKLAKMNDKLKQSRDILLPRLMSGTINVES